MVKTFDLCKTSIGLSFILKIMQIDDFWGRHRLKRSTSACLCVFHDTRMSGPPLRKQEFHVKCGFSPTCKRFFQMAQLPNWPMAPAQQPAIIFRWAVGDRQGGRACPAMCGFCAATSRLSGPAAGGR